MTEDKLRIANREFSSRLLVGSGKYASYPQMVQAWEKSGAEIVTVAVRRVNLSDRNKESLLDYIDTKKYFILPNTAGCYTADEAVRAARLGREAGLSNWVKLEVIGDERTLFPDNLGLLQATETLAKEDFIVLPYTNDDLVMATTADRCRRRSCHAAWGSDRVWHGHSERGQYPNPEGNDSRGAADYRCGCGNGFRRHSGHGTGRRRNLDEYRNRASPGSSRDGGGHESRHPCWKTGLPGGTHSQETLRDGK